MSRQRFFFPDFEIETASKPVNVASVPQRSPFRYPGGKTWLVPTFRKWCKSFLTSPRRLIEPFAGGGIISLTAAFENLAEQVVMVEKDDDVIAVWETIFGGDAKWLAEKIMRFDLNMENLSKILETKPKSRREHAFQTILRNRTAHGGILANGAGLIKNGENGKGIKSRWYPQTIARRINMMSSIIEKVEFIGGDAFDVLTKYKRDAHAFFFIDPPYTAGGKRAGARLYRHSEIDHEELFFVCSRLAGHFLMTYDYAEEVCLLAKKYRFETKPIAMKNTHHAPLTELLISRDLNWLN